MDWKGSWPFFKKEVISSRNCFLGAYCRDLTEIFGPNISRRVTFPRVHSTCRQKIHYRVKALFLTPSYKTHDVPDARKKSTFLSKQSGSREHLKASLHLSRFKMALTKKIVDRVGQEYLSFYRTDTNSRERHWVSRPGFGLPRCFRPVAVKLRLTRPSATAGPGVFCPPRWRFSVTEARFNADVIDHAVLRDINPSLTSHQIGWAQTCFVPAYQASGLP